MKRVYIAGAYSADNVLDVLRNIGKGRKMGARLFALGYYPFVPWLDSAFVIDNPEGFFSVKQFYNYSMSWLDVSECMLVLPNYERSAGTLLEIERAKELNIPIFYSIDKLIKWSRNE